MEPFVRIPGDVPVYRIPLLEDTGLVEAVFTTRHGGTSPAPYASMNLSWNRGDDPTHTQANYMRLCDAMGWDAAWIAQSRAVHGTQVLEATEADTGGVSMGLSAPMQEGDGLMTHTRGIILRQTFADCVPIWLLDPVQKVIAMLHAGWRGTVGGIAAHGVEALCQRYGTHPGDVLAAIGPSIHACCFAIREDVATPLEQSFPRRGLVTIGGDGLLHGNLQACNRLFLEKAGVLPGHIAVSDLCTACRTDVFFSHRREKGQCGAMAGMLVLKQ